MTKASRWIRLTSSSLFAAMIVGGVSSSTALAADTLEIPGLKNGTIGFALVGARWAIHQTPDGKVECPAGFNEGPNVSRTVGYCVITGT